MAHRGSCRTNLSGTAPRCSRKPSSLKESATGREKGRAMGLTTKYPRRHCLKTAQGQEIYDQAGTGDGSCARPAERKAKCKGHRSTHAERSSSISSLSGQSKGEWNTGRCVCAEFWRPKETVLRNARQSSIPCHLAGEARNAHSPRGTSSGASVENRQELLDLLRMWELSAS